MEKDIIFLDTNVFGRKEKYDFEHSYRTSIEVVTISPDGFIWFNDWNEGEKNVIVQSYISIDDLYNILLSP